MLLDELCFCELIVGRTTETRRDETSLQRKIMKTGPHYLFFSPISFPVGVDKNDSLNCMSYLLNTIRGQYRATTCLINSVDIGTVRDVCSSTVNRHPFHCFWRKSPNRVDDARDETHHSRRHFALL